MSDPINLDALAERGAAAVSAKVRRVATSAHSETMHICGIQPAASEERLSLRQVHHPGFGCTTLLKNDEQVWSAVRYEDARSLGWLERKFCDDDQAVYTLDVDGPMVSYTLTRRGPRYWVLTGSRQGFA